MSIEALIKQGWFNKPEDVDIQLSDKQIEALKAGETVLATDSMGLDYAIYFTSSFLRRKSLQKGLKPEADDVILRRV